MNKDYTNRATIQKFAASCLLEGVDHYKSDAFLTYEEMLNMPLGAHAVVVVRRMGVDLYAHWYKSCFEWPKGVASDWLTIYKIRRDIQNGPLCRDNVVDYALASYEEATEYLNEFKDSDKLVDNVCYKCFTKLDTKDGGLFCPICYEHRTRNQMYEAVQDYVFIDE